MPSAPSPLMPTIEPEDDEVALQLLFLALLLSLLLLLLLSRLLLLLLFLLLLLLLLLLTAASPTDDNDAALGYCRADCADSDNNNAAKPRHDSVGVMWTGAAKPP